MYIYNAESAAEFIASWRVASPARQRMEVVFHTNGGQTSHRRRLHVVASTVDPD